MKKRTKSPVQPDKIAEFTNLIDTAEKNENDVQRFIEENTAFMPTPDTLHHDLHLSSVIAKFPIGERSTDYAFLSKNSVEWKLTLVELEDSSKSIFKASSKDCAFTSEFNDAVAQIDVWRDHLRTHMDQLLERLHPLLVPPQMARNKLSVAYMLVIGRSAELETNGRRRDRLASYGKERDLRVITYDTILRNVQEGRYELNAVLRANSRGYRLQSVEGLPSNMFAYIMPEHLELSPKAESGLRAEGYDIDAWHAGKPLTFNEKWTFDSDPDLYKNANPLIKKMIAGRKK